jgi:hypothetical protein
MSTGRRSTIVRAGLLYLAITTGYLAIWILLAPKGFYNSFPSGPANWVSKLPPFNEHLERDFGAASLGLAVLAAIAALRMTRQLVQAAGWVFICASIPHLAYHLTTTDSYSTSDNIQSLVGLALPVGIAVALLVASRELPADA